MTTALRAALCVQAAGLLVGAADLLLGELSGPQLRPAEQQRVGHLSERVQVDQPHPALLPGAQISPF